MFSRIKIQYKTRSVRFGANFFWFWSRKIEELKREIDFYFIMDSEREKLRKRIIEGMCLISSTYGLAANYVQGDAKKEEQYIFECYRQTHHKNFEEHLGTELFNDLINYNVKYNNKHSTDLNS